MDIPANHSTNIVQTKAERNNPTGRGSAENAPPGPEQLLASPAVAAASTNFKLSEVECIGIVVLLSLAAFVGAFVAMLLGAAGLALSLYIITMYLFGLSNGLVLGYSDRNTADQTTARSR